MTGVVGPVAATSRWKGSGSVTAVGNEAMSETTGSVRTTISNGRSVDPPLSPRPLTPRSSSKSMWWASMQFLLGAGLLGAQLTALVSSPT
jgi:hypothetical protein